MAIPRGTRQKPFPGEPPAELKALANKRDVPYQSLLKMYLAERIAAELQALAKDGDR